MSIFKVLDKMEELVQSGGSLPWPMNDRVVVYRDHLVRLIARARECIPEEVKKAHYINQEARRIETESNTEASRVKQLANSDADRVLREAEEKAREILRAAKEESLRLVQEHEVTQKAREEARRIVLEARGQNDKMREESERLAREIREGADRFATGVLTGMEGELTRILAIIKRHQDTLAQQRQAPPASGRPTEAAV